MSRNCPILCIDEILIYSAQLVVTFAAIKVFITIVDCEYLKYMLINKDLRETKKIELRYLS